MIAPPTTVVATVVATATPTDSATATALATNIPQAIAKLGGGVSVQRQRLVVAGEGDEGGGGGGWESPIFTFWNPLLSGRRRIISAMPHSPTP